ncbi:MAG TPA: adenosylcobinamide-phosphate synthase CbiB [Stellaceae bacterium]|nr:adenosylcobinamide-phosphate synthase CbiB [Stellaceae bacterium]
MLLVSPGAADPLLILLLALALDLLIGDLTAFWRMVPHPVSWIGGAVAYFDARLNREHRSPQARRVRGILTVVVLVVAAALAGLGLALALHRFRLGWAIEAAVVAILLAQKSLFSHVAAVAAALQGEGLAAGRAAVGAIVGRDPESLDEHGVARAAIESLAENFSDGVVAPALWYALLGLPGLFVYKTANTLDSMIGYRSPRHVDFGWAAARLDDLLNLAPARLAGLLLGCAAMVTPRANGRDALLTMMRDAGKHRSPNAGWPEAAAAGALGLALAGPRRYGGILVEEPWLGTGRARATPADMAKALRLYLMACLALATLVLAALVALYAL